MDIFLALLVAVDDQVKIVAGLGDQGDELLAFAGNGADVIHQGKVPVRCQAVDLRNRLGLLLKHPGKSGEEARHHFPVDIKGVTFGGLSRRNVVQFQVLPADIAVLCREFQLVPSVFFLHDLYFGAVGQAVDDIESYTGTGTDIQVAAVGADMPGTDRIFLRLIAINRNGDSVIGDRHMQRRQEVSQKLRVL